MSSVTPPPDTGWLPEETGRLLGFGRAFPHPLGGAAWLRTDGTPDLHAPVQTWITARMAHVYSLAHLLGVPGADTLADTALAGLTGVLHDDRHGGWHPSVAADGVPATGKSCYDHAFVVLAAASGTLAHRPGARRLLTEALGTLTGRFWEPEHRMFADEWDTRWQRLDDYRGLNANMHAVEAMLAAYDATGQRECLDRALAITERTTGWGRAHGWRLPEHYDAGWRPLLDYHRDRPRDPFKPFGATVGHALEWSRLILHLEATLGTAAPDWLSPAAEALFHQAVADGWAVDGAPGFVYTTDWDGTPVVRERMHWVAAEALAAAAALHRRTGERDCAEWFDTWSAYVREHFLDREQGSWWHELDTANRPAASTWPGKPDLYHAVQATLIPRAPLTPGLAAACAMGAVR
ncbi:mannose/cellobiose epimerase-like protein (N-acyl-D-glucosamine 2-epimerase family) [Actinoplanes octamycinicus]|uniref:Mannose/cellobiose epimerase-like protein (N-acyl-D-glucosamine 2-epimerase family) n=1 Tax=Actinoplanes octamycinicus TaxID=135948 RepID=A0A7W7GXX0_9ACTN|nr:AGE family epimerase/isomerase [Actinoplanes octamycinicus]MBB4740316.1 mannose/cellobiose epimerase-like protein (N-acyl-D-glucosamine 2-epimerase family) [Actinoplanes octamycinicus]GIE62608.1 N-acylglucosamine 2-epimerase [Actinoplanes octamycinicus]